MTFRPAPVSTSSALTEATLTVEVVLFGSNRVVQIHSVHCASKSKIRLKMASHRLSGAVLVILCGFAALVAAEHPGSNSVHSEDVASQIVEDPNSVINGSLHDFLPKGKVHVLIQRIFMVPVEDGEDSEDAESSEQIPSVEFEKLKSAAKTAGLPEAKADRLMRAVQMSNVTYPELAHLRGVLSNSTTSADLAEKARMMLEENCMDKAAQGVAAKAHREVQLPNAYGQNAGMPTVAVEGQPGAANGRIDPKLLQRLQVSASLAGLEGPRLQQFVSTVARANLNGTQISELQRAIMEHAPSAQDLTTVAQVLHLNNADLTGTLQSTLTARSAAEEMNKTARAAVEDTLKTLYTAQRLCGYIPAVSNKYGAGVAAPGQFPWNAAVFTASNTFLCQGTLLSASHVIAPASCILKYKTDNMPLKVVLNAWDLPVGSSEQNFLLPLEIFAKSAVVHSQYTEGAANQNNNIGLIVLAENVDFERYPTIFPACIIGTDLLTNVMKSQSDQACIVTGWSSTSSPAGHQTASLLTYGDVTVTNTGCPSTTSSCASARACGASAGSPILCPGTTPNRYFLRSIIAEQPNCDANSASSLVSVVSIAENFPFFLQYLTLNPLGAFGAPAAPALATPAAATTAPLFGGLGALLPGLGLGL